MKSSFVEQESSQGWGVTNLLAHSLLKLMAMSFNRRPALKEYLRWDGGWIDMSIGMETESGSVRQGISFRDGHARVHSSVPDDANAVLVFKDEATVREMISSPPNELFNLLMKNKIVPRGNLAYLQLFNFLISVLMKNKHIKMLKKASAKEQAGKNLKSNGSSGPKAPAYLRAKSKEKGVKYLEDAYLSDYGIEDFPRLKDFLDIHFTVRPAICHERPLLLTEFFMKHGFEKDADGNDWVPELRQARAFRHLMENRKPIIRKNDLVAGTTTTREIGVVIYPDTHGTMIWGELFTTPHRLLNPYDVDPETIDVMHKKVFPFWFHRNIREWVRDNKGYPLCQKLDERFAVCFLWKTASLSHTIVDYPKILSLGTTGLIKEMDGELAKTPAKNREKRDLLEAMKISFRGINSYAANLASQAALEAEVETDPVRRKELSRLAAICRRVPARPARTLDEAVNAMWIIWVAIHMENTNAGFSLGRLDQWLQPYFEADIKKQKSAKAREEYIRHAIELVGCFYMRCTDHLPLVPDIGNYLFGGSSSDQAITLGGVTPDGRDAVNDMTYIFLKVTEMLKIRDPNVNARYHKGVNSEAYLRRLAEVNLNTTATPSIHNDEAVMDSLAEFKYPAKHLRDWSATGCVEPTLSGRHMGHTNCMMFNMVAALEMAMNNGRHPLMRWDVGPKTGSVENGDFDTFEKFYKAFCAQLDFLAGQTCTYNNMLGEAHQALRPTPLLSGMIDGCISSGKDVTKGGARYNSSGTALIGLADVTDSLMAIKTLIYDEKKVSFPDMLRAVQRNFKGDEALLALIKNRTPLFGSGNKEAVAMANRIVKFAHDTFGKRTNYRGGKYTAGFWSMSNHVAFGNLTGALPSGRLAGKPFTPGLTPEAHASKSLLDNIRDVSQLKAENMNNNIAFNVKVVPAASDSHEEAVEHIHSYAKSYMDLGGMQMQFNVVSTGVLRDAMENPDQYRDLLVRISGYNAYFVTLNRDMQIELIERAEYGV